MGPQITETQRRKQAQTRPAKKQGRATLPPPFHPLAFSRPAEDEGPDHVGPHEAPPQANPGRHLELHDHGRSARELANPRIGLKLDGVKK